MRFILTVSTCLLLVGSVFVLTSCCKSFCRDGNISVIDFHGFDAMELEKIKVLRFNQDDFTSAVDSYFVATNNLLIKDTTRVYLDKPLASDFDFKISIENAIRTYTLSDIQTKKEDCSCGPGNYKTIVGYRLNGAPYSVQNNNSLEIKK